jgi:RNA polymerase sigma factor (TIGR02999 family)
LDPVVNDDGRAAGHFLPSAYKELRKLAAQKLANERSGQTLQPTALVHEVYLRLVARNESERGDEPKWKNHGHFFAAAAEAMRRILVERARRKGRVKHGGGRRRVDLAGQDVLAKSQSDDIVALDEALTRLAAEDAEAAQVVQLHFFAGLSIEQAAEVLGVSRATAYRQWTYARAWLGCAMGDDGQP